MNRPSIFLAFFMLFRDYFWAFLKFPPSFKIFFLFFYLGLKMGENSRGMGNYVACVPACRCLGADIHVRACMLVRKFAQTCIQCKKCQIHAQGLWVRAAYIYIHTHAPVDGNAFSSFSKFAASFLIHALKFLANVRMRTWTLASCLFAVDSRLCG